jgi:hypothetical protein
VITVVLGQIRAEHPGSRGKPVVADGDGLLDVAVEPDAVRVVVEKKPVDDAQQSD